MDFKKVFKVIFIDFMGLLIGIINGFLLPKYLSIESYAYIKTFALYVGYSGMFHLGFSDGMYILLGGKNISEVKKEKIKGYILTLLKILFLVLIVLFTIDIFMVKDVIFTCFILYTIPYQITLFVMLLYRATGEFDKYMIIAGLINGLNLLATLSTIFILKSPMTYIIIQICGYLIIALVCLIKFIFINKKAETIELKEIKLLINIGFIIMIASTINNLFFSLDRWIVKWSFTINDFAYYSFGVSMLGFFTTLISSITIVFYPYLAKSDGTNKIVADIKKYIILICSFAPTGYFILQIIVENFLSQYLNSLEVLGILILTIPFMTVINVIYSNLYKANNRGKDYLVTTIKMLSIALILNIIVVYFGGKSSYIAYATLISLIIWYIYSSRHFQGLEIRVREGIYLTIYIVSYIIIAKLGINTMIKAITFSTIMFISIVVFYKEELVELTKLFLKQKQSL